MADVPIKYPTKIAIQHSIHFLYIYSTSLKLQYGTEDPI